MAAIAAAALFCLDPNFLAHAAVVKNDVAITLVGTALAMATWYAGRRLTLTSAAAVVLLAAAALVTKFSGPLLLIALAATLAVRVLLPGPWPWGRKRRATTIAGRAGLASGLLLCTALISVLAIWASYSFRFAPAPDGSQWEFDMGLRDAAVYEIIATHPDQPSVTQAELDEHHVHPATLVRVLTFCNEHHLLPQSWLYGMLYVYTTSRFRASFLCGHLNPLGSPWYFPFAFLVKTPLATLTAVALAAILGATLTLRRLRLRLPAGVSAESLWSIACLTIPFLIIGYADVTARLNIGVRHILPLYALLYIATACAIAYAWRHWGRNGRVLITGLAAALAIETAAAFPGFIPFFNRAAGGPGGGIRLLGDSNLDWGQDLPLLAQWQRNHPDRKLYLLYFGLADPAYYGIRYEPLPGYVNLRTDVPRVQDLPTQPGVIAISASNLQGMHLKPEIREMYAPLWNQTPLDVLGGSIYLYEYNPGK